MLFIFWDFTEKKSGIFVSFSFSTLRSERRFTLSIKRGHWEIFKRCLPLVLVGSQEVCSVRILFYVNVGVAANWFLVRNDVVSFSVVLRVGVKYTQIGFINRLQNSRFFFSTSVKKSVKRGVSPVSLSVFSLVPDLLFDCSRVLEYAKIRTVLQCILSTEWINVNWPP